MDNNRAYARQLKELGYRRKVIAFRLCDDEPADAEPYGDGLSFHCAIVAEAWEEGRKPFFITNRNVLCGGAVCSGLGNRKLSKEEFDAGMEQVIGMNKGYESRRAMRRVTQQVPHFFKHHTYQIIGSLEEVQSPDVVMVVADAYQVMRLTKAYTWKTGELAHGLSGTAWCTNSFPLVYRTKAITYNMGDESSRILMGLGPEELYCFIHSELLPLVVENLPNIQTGLEMG